MRMEGRVNTLEMVPEMVGIIEVLADAIEQLDPPNQHLAKVARFASRIATKAKIKSMGASPPNPGWMGWGWRTEPPLTAKERKAQNPQEGVLLFALLLLLGSGVSSAHQTPGGFV